ncbi:uncharacterized protein PHALS_09414 [Plasmopara halstedii]|uniref:RxLR-like protein n=1 Tax=Plasmopara halstedii TaxID=4781 RepID=A0A0P1A5B1_PLAHL|nr:uncharacterized protein PHALS_09414 [Plasmopara halstedii]CEG35287.1 hypothetical protein PHALS_09414 [Plasmopara halstedii]|eukprot:XP_024571656.1 hypothetical protein PHALS_09414 [Plasmopara halstedii]
MPKTGTISCVLRVCVECLLYLHVNAKDINNVERRIACSASSATAPNDCNSPLANQAETLVD